MLECVREVYSEEVQWLDAYRPPTVSVAAADPEEPPDSSPVLIEGSGTSSAEGWPTDSREPADGSYAAAPHPSEHSGQSDITARHTTASPAAADTPDYARLETATAPAAEELPQPGQAVLEQWHEQLFVLSFWALLGTAVLMLILAATNRAVIFYDSTDAWWSIAPFFCLVVGYALIGNLAPSEDAPFASTAAEKAVAAVAMLLSAGAVVVNYRNAIRHNRSILLGVIVGTFKLAIALFMALTVIGQLSRISDTASTRRQMSGALLILAVVGLLWHVLVNGKRVYERRGWVGNSARLQQGSLPLPARHATATVPTPRPAVLTKTTNRTSRIKEKESHMQQASSVMWVGFYASLGFESSEDGQDLWDEHRLLSPDAHNANSDGSLAPQIFVTVVRGESGDVISWSLDVFINGESSSVSSFDFQASSMEDDLDMDDELERSLWMAMRAHVGGRYLFPPDDLSYLVGNPDGDIVDSDSFWEGRGETLSLESEDDDVIDRIENSIGRAMLVLIHTATSSEEGEAITAPSNKSELRDLVPDEFPTEKVIQLYLAEGEEEDGD